ncbi:MurR/RpiR family transcriptional regulator [Pollutimonas harenae]|uniref:MurR/RpiR family transcriptional regulator n=1 Tax=Pollutimonas harenae TaxID=657015 RepID=A0A853GU06_9BURK|nr:MurR/RpiR family transcriptional regulator [Pollutimonas harenae]NYT84266.1 MurR/RpiR family transcriptional regulator [Pollutimonas harenae]TEA73324.1 MurR/RpiR family transcriptional regulator [Pollutimonas harenae]
MSTSTTPSGQKTAPDNLEALTARIQRDFADMTPQFQVGARHLLDFPLDVPVASMRKIAAQAGVQPATLLRLAKLLGYAGWPELKAVFVRSMQQNPKRYADRARELLHDKNLHHAVGRIVAVQADNIRLNETSNAENLPLTVKMLSKAQQVYVAGFRASHAPAFLFQYQYRLFRPSVTLLRGDAGTLEMEWRAFTKNDAVVIIGFAPYSNEALQVARAARRAGSRVLAICDSAVAPIALEADCVLLFATETPSFFPSSAAASALVELLIEQLLAKAGKQAITRIEAAEDQLHQTGAYL